MKRSILLALAVASMGLGGCASTGGSRSTGGYHSDVDVGKVIAVNQWAQTRGATVVWVNYPQRSKVPDSASSVN